MRVLLDHSSPAPLSRYLIGHDVTEAFERGWERLKNGDLLTAAETAGFEILVTSDKNIRYQQNLTGRKSPLSCLAKDNGRRYIRTCSFHRCGERGHTRQLYGVIRVQKIIMKSAMPQQNATAQARTTAPLRPASREAMLSLLPGT